MDVYLVPVGPDRHELYCEVPDEPEGDESGEPPKGLFRRLRAQFNAMLAEAERERRQERSQGDASHAEQGWGARFKAKAMRWVAESIAEQRLLWHLRRQTRARLFTRPTSTRRRRCPRSRRSSSAITRSIVSG